MFKITSGLTFLLLLFAFVPASAASPDESFHANGSIRVVVTVAAIVMTGILVYIFMLERRLKRLEQDKKS